MYIMLYYVIMYYVDRKFFLRKILTYQTSLHQIKNIIIIQSIHFLTFILTRYNCIIPIQVNRNTIIIHFILNLTDVKKTQINNNNVYILIFIGIKYNNTHSLIKYILYIYEYAQHQYIHVKNIFYCFFVHKIIKKNNFNL